MALLEVFRNPSDTGDGTLNSAQIAAALALATEGIQLETGPWNVRATGGAAIKVPINRRLSMYGATVSLASTDGAGANVVMPAASGQCTGIVIEGGTINGGRTLKAWGSETGACIALAGQNAYTPAGAIIRNITLVDGVTQQSSVNSVDGLTLQWVIARATAAPAQAAHGCDFDAVANDKPTKNLLIEDCDLDAYGQECIKFENVQGATVRRTTLRMYVILVQDQVDCYAGLSGIVFDQCTLLASVNVAFMKRRRIPGSAYVNLFPTGKTCTLSGSNTIGGTVTSPGSVGGAGEYVFSAGDVGQMVGYSSGQGTGAAQITAVNVSGGITATVVDVFSVLTLPSWGGTGSPRWVVAGTDNGGAGDLTVTRCTFGPGGLVWAQSAEANCYGTQTFSDNVFSPAGNSWSYPAGVTITQSGNLYAGLPFKRFARPTADAKYGALGGAGIAGVNQGAARGNAPTDIVTAVGYAVAGDEVWALDGLYAATGSTNRNINCGGKAIKLRAETMYGVVIDGTSGGSAQCVASSADPAGASIWGLVAMNWSGGSGAGFSITGGSLRLAHTRASKCTASNSGAGYRVTGGTPTIEDYDAEECTASGGGGGGVYCAVAAAVFRRGRVRACAATANLGGGIRVATNAGTTFDGLEITGCTAGTAGGGIGASVGCTLRNVTAVGNVCGATGGMDLWVANGQTVTLESSILQSSDAGSFFPINNGTTGNLIATNCTIQGGASAGRFGNAGGTNAWTGITTAGPQFADAANGNVQLAALSPARTAGTAREERWDRAGAAFVGAIQGAAA